MSLADSMIAQQCLILLEGMERERKAMSLWQRWKTRKEYKRKRQRALSLINNTQE